MDTFTLLMDLGSGSVSNDLQGIYAGGGCTGWIAQMQNIWTNYYDIKKTNYKDSGIITRFETAQTSVT